MMYEYDTTGFNRGLDKRDIFFGDPRCVICGSRIPKENIVLVESSIEACCVVFRHHLDTADELLRYLR